MRFRLCRAYDTLPDEALTYLLKGHLTAFSLDMYKCSAIQVKCNETGRYTVQKGRNKEKIR